MKTVNIYILALDTCATTGQTTGGVLAELIAQGAADAHLYADPEVTNWRMRVKKSTNFAMESILQTFTGAPTWGSEVSLTVNRTGDLLYWQYVIIDIPAIAAIPLASGEMATTNNGFPCADPCDPCGDGPETGECENFNEANIFDDDDLFNVDDGIDNVNRCTGLTPPYANWVNEIGFAAVSRASFSIGGQRIDSVYSHYMHMWEELSGQPGKRLEEMIGKRFTIAQLVADSQFDRRLYVPLPFYYTRHSGNTLPLVSLQFHSVQVHVCFAQLSKLIQASSCDVRVVRCSDSQPVNNNCLNALLESTYVYLDMQERDRFAVGSFQQLITQVQQFSTVSRSGSVHAQINFNHPVLELIWAVQRKCQADANNTFNYSGYQHRDPIRKVCLRLNNLQRFDREGRYFRLVQPYQFHTNIPKSFVYSYSFALDPESCQPTGSLNFSRIDNVDMTVVLQDELSNLENALYVFARSFNILRFKEKSFLQKVPAYWKGINNRTNKENSWKYPCFSA